MRRRFNPSYIVVPLVYVVLIFGLVMLQFTGGKLFNASLGPISLSGAFALGGANETKQIASLNVQVAGFQFIFDKDHVVELLSEDDSVVKLRLEGYDTRENGYVVRFNHSVELIFANVSGEQQTVTISAELPQSMLPLKALRIPYQTSADAAVNASEGQPLLNLSWRGDSYQLLMPSRSFADQELHRLVMPGESSRLIRIAQRVTTNQNLFEEFQVPTLSQKEYADSVQAFINTAYNGWKTSRFNSSSGTWSFRDGENRFNEELMIALLSEAWKRDEYTRVYNEMRTTADQHPAQMSWRSSVFMGNLRRVTNELTGLDRTESNRLLAMINQGNNDLWLTPHLFRFALDRGSEGLSAALIKYTEGLDPSLLSPTQALGLLQNWLLTELPDPKLDDSLARFGGLVKSSLLNAVINVDEGFFFQPKGEKGDGYYTVLAGRVLQQYGERTTDERLVQLGRNMVNSMVKLADDLGFLPNQLEFSAGAISAVLKSRGPEDFYWLLHSNPAYPHEVSLYSQLGPGYWIYTLATVNSVKIKPSEYRFNLSYPQSRMHHLFIRGLPAIDPLVGMELFGRTWRNASDFEDYPKGRYYNPDNRTLMIKYFDASVQRDIVVWYNN